MATAATIAFSRSPAPFERVRLFFGGTHWWLNIFGLTIAWPIFAIQHDVMFFAYAIATVVPCCAIAAAVLDTKVADRLAFTTLLPRASSPKWLLLLPLYAAASLLIGAAVLTSGASPVAGLATLGCCWWALAIGRWLGRRWWTLAAIPALMLAPAAVLLLVRTGNWAGAALASVGFAAIGVLLSPGLRRDAAAARSVVQAPGGPTAVSQFRARPEGVVAAIRLWRLGAVHVSRLLVIGSVFGALLSFVWLPNVMGVHQGFLILALATGFGIGQSSKAGRHDFLCVLPIDRARLFAGSVLPWIVPLLVVPVLLLARLLLESPDGDGPLAAALRDAEGFDVRELRQHLGALLPQTWPRGQFPAEHWAPVVGALCAHVVAMTLMALALLASFSAAWLLSERKAVRVAVVPRWAVYLLPLAVYYGSTVPSLLLHRPQSLLLRALLLVDTALIWFLVWRLPPTPAAAAGGRR